MAACAIEFERFDANPDALTAAALNLMTLIIILVLLAHYERYKRSALRTHEKD